MPSNKLKTEVRINDPEENDVTLALSPAQAVAVLDLLIAGATLRINLVTPSSSSLTPSHDTPLAYAS